MFHVFICFLCSFTFLFVLFVYLLWFFCVCLCLSWLLLFYIVFYMFSLCLVASYLFYLFFHCFLRLFVYCFLNFICFAWVVHDVFIFFVLLGMRACKKGNKAAMQRDPNGPVYIAARVGFPEPKHRTCRYIQGPGSRWPTRTAYPAWNARATTAQTQTTCLYIL